MNKNIFYILSLVIALLTLACENDDAGDASNGTEDADAMISDVTVEVHDTVNTILVVTWSQDVDADEVFVRFTFENDEWYESYPKPGDVGEHQEVILGVPENTDVTFHIALTQADQQLETSAYQGTTEAVPASMPFPKIESYNPSLASPNRWLFGSVEKTPSEGEYYSGPFWLYIIDRQGRIVWYYADIADNPILGFPRISRDGRFIFAGTRTPWHDSEGFVPRVIKMTLDYEYFEEVEMPLSDNVDMTDDGSFLFNTGIFDYSDVWLMEYLPDGSQRTIWNCSAVFSDCYSNTINWNPLDDTVLMSFPYLNTVAEIDRNTGELIGQYGSVKRSYDFDSETMGFDFQHYANITPEGTLMVSSHLTEVNGKHAFMEFEIDRENEMLKEKWIYREGDEWAHYMGEAHKVPNGDGNVLGNYGTGGVIKEITPSKQTAWYAKWDTFFTDDTYNNMVGHCTLLDDLYAINRGPE